MLFHNNKKAQKNERFYISNMANDVGAALACAVEATNDASLCEFAGAHDQKDSLIRSRDFFVGKASFHVELAKNSLVAQDYAFFLEELRKSVARQLDQIAGVSE